MIPELQKGLMGIGYKSAVLPIYRLTDLLKTIEDLRNNGTLDPTFYREWLTEFTLDGHRTMPSARSIIITAARQPKTFARFTVSGKRFSTVIPPTYTHETDDTALETITECLKPNGFTTVPAVIPKKLMVVRSGLAEYGRNNIAYVPGWGSFFRLNTFLSDMPCKEHPWRDLRMMDACQRCHACITACPTNAIPKDRFLIHAEYCLTRFYEMRPNFPDWIDPSVHNCLIGCIISQDICPSNKYIKDWKREGCDFSEEETALILCKSPPETLPEKTLS